MKPRTPIKIFWTINIITFLTLFMFSIFQIGRLTHQVYFQKEYKDKLSKALKENEILEINFSKVDSLGNIKNYLENGNFVKANKIKYIQIFESSVVSK